MYIDVDLAHFDSFPIEFKEINPEDFQYVFDTSGTRISRSDFIIENGGDKILIEPNDDGYINDTLQGLIELEHKNTVVINAAVGQGKSHAIIQTVKRYFDAKEKYLIFIASPFVSLVKQYHNDVIKAGIDSGQIYSYEKLGRDTTKDYINKTVQIVTVNTLLGNPGEDGFKNSDIKREYINDLVKHCQEKSIKVVFIYDEIHDSFHNFKQEYIFNLWKWKSVIHKNFVLSATYNEASKIVIEYLAELTDFRIKIIESERKRFPKKQSDLYLHFSSSYSFTHKTKEISNVIEDLIARDKNIDILSYSRNLAKNLLNTSNDIGKLIFDTFGEVKDCTSELISNQREENEEPTNQYDNDKCNIGTNFKTGVSIKKDNHALVIILPPRSSRLTFRNKYGIFSGGINSIIQALARQRKKGEIHIILPKPDHFDYDTLDHSGMSPLQKDIFKDHYELVKYHKTPEKFVKYIKLNRQDYFLREFYDNKLKGNVLNEITAVSASGRNNTLPKLSFPTFQEFKLESGEDYLANKFSIFGEDISAYTTYASLANQFINCRLRGISFKPVIAFDEGSVQSMLHFVYKNFFGEDYLESLGQYSNFNLFYQDFRNSLYADYQLKFKKEGSSDYENIEKGSPVAKKFELQLLLYTYKLKHFSLKSTDDEDYTRSDYFLECISHSKDIDLSTLAEGDYKHRVKLYQHINYFREKLINSLYEYHRGRDHFFCTPTNMWGDFFSTSDVAKVQEIIVLLESDSILRDNMFEFKRRFIDNRTLNGKLKTFYSILLEDFLFIDKKVRDPYITLYGSRRNCKIINSIKTIPSKAIAINLIESQDYLHSYPDTTDSSEELEKLLKSITL
ncbi:DEAD/DEAH box helicase [Epilithonimonas xixisoli]|uniref:Type III restriction/modification enzyme restriction subunit n=1 Tax=Epilithonimonas xixisoli TaxID=1476462 RepID=A0A4R8I7H7_9FLAO|nr:DEAD/DEAH box helicase [Epilithonimonas xixisoli]TDX84609.1 type III restriction/modification enzyme restriction subunit [Epilithonimonas xixisoli]